VHPDGGVELQEDRFISVEEAVLALDQRLAEEILADAPSRLTRTTRTRSTTSLGSR